MINKSQIPQEIIQITNKLEDAGFDAHLVGGCVRDLLMQKVPNDWDITTNAKPEQIIEVFGEDNTFYENNFGTVGVKANNNYDYDYNHNHNRNHNRNRNRNRNRNHTNDSNNTGNSKSTRHEIPYGISCLVEDGGVIEETSGKSAVFSDEDGIVEITPYRTEGKYSDARHPDKITFSDSLYEDLKRRDFTMNAIAFRVKTLELIDKYNGQNDIKNKVIKAVGNANKRFAEDALRMMRAVRFLAQLNFAIESETMLAISSNVELLQKVSHERIRDEFNKIILSDNPAIALGIAEQLGLLQYIIPELREGIGCEQGKKAHKYDVFEHNLRALQHAADKNLSLHERLSALFHDIGKPRTRRKKGNGYTFYGHEVVGAKMTKDIMNRLRYDKVTQETVVKLVRWHMFFSDPEQITLSAVRRMITNVGKDHIQDLLRLRMCDRIGSGRPKEQPFRFRKYMAMVDEALRDPITVGMLKINGGDIMQEFNEKPGPRIGWVLHALLEEVLDDPKNNTKEFLIHKAKELLQLSDKELKEKGIEGKIKRKQADEAEIAKLHAKHCVH